uniref:Uncharacterized protein n=1 Tax=Anguilla anguilla TaxID=7936 RepID=A0A0E9S905_ANGAN
MCSLRKSITIFMIEPDFGFEV